MKTMLRLSCTTNGCQDETYELNMSLQNLTEETKAGYVTDYAYHYECAEDNVEVEVWEEDEPFEEKYSNLLTIVEEAGRFPMQSIEDGDTEEVIEYLQESGYDVAMSADTGYLLCSKIEKED